MVAEFRPGLPLPLLLACHPHCVLQGSEEETKPACSLICFCLCVLPGSCACERPKTVAVVAKQASRRPNLSSGLASHSLVQPPPPYAPKPMRLAVHSDNGRVGDGEFGPELTPGLPHLTQSAATSEPYVPWGRVSLQDPLCPSRRAYGVGTTPSRPNGTFGAIAFMVWVLSGWGWG